MQSLRAALLRAGVDASCRLASEIIGDLTARQVGAEAPARPKMGAPEQDFSPGPKNEPR